VVLVGHSYSGCVITVAGAPDKVAGLVYVAGFVPDEGESITDLQARYPSLAMGNFLQPRPLPDGARGCSGVFGEPGRVMPPVSRGFRGCRSEHVDAGRVPPGQYVTRDFPVLSAGPTPHTPLQEWSFTIGGAVDEPVSWTWEEFIALPAETVDGCWVEADDLNGVARLAQLDRLVSRLAVTVAARRRRCPGWREPIVRSRGRAVPLRSR